MRGAARAPQWLMPVAATLPSFIYYRAVACIWPRASALSIATKSGKDHSLACAHAHDGQPASSDATAPHSNPWYSYTQLLIETVGSEYPQRSRLPTFRACALA